MVYCDKEHYSLENWEDSRMDEDDRDYKLFLEGNLLGFEELVIRYKDHLIYFIQRYVKDIYTAEDLAQDTFVDVYLHKERYQLKNNFKTYLFTIGRNKAVDYIRKYSRVTTMEDVEELYEEESLEGIIIKKDDATRIHSNIKKLKRDYQVAIILIDFEELTYKEAAKVLNKTVSQIKILIYRARKALGKLLEEGEYSYEK